MRVLQTRSARAKSRKRLIFVSPRESVCRACGNGVGMEGYMAISLPDGDSERSKCTTTNRGSGSAPVDADAVNARAVDGMTLTGPLTRLRAELRRRGVLR
jgi:hypothetical protein